MPRRNRSRTRETKWTTKWGKNRRSMFAHERLNVYGKALAFAGEAAELTSGWDKRHAVVDHLSRAAESIAINLAEAARQRDGTGRLRVVDYAIGSSLECAACLDIAAIKQLQIDCLKEKQRLREITRMLIGLRKGWTRSLGEEVVTYKAESDVEPEPLFHHERLRV